MCRYAMVSYKPHFACFDCRKTFKRRLWSDIKKGEENSTEAKCPDCGQLMANMGLDFEAPKKSNKKAWAHIQDLFSVGITFHSCGCSGPGYIPKDKESLIEHYHELIEFYNVQLAFWRKRKEPSDAKEIQREFSKNWDHIGLIPLERREIKGKEIIKNEAAINYWISRVSEVNIKLEKIS